MTAKITIPTEVQGAISVRIDAFNKKKLSKYDWTYVADYKGKFIYVMRKFGAGTSVELEQAFRLTYDGDIENMDFAIYLYSSEKYKADEFFPGDKFLDGTIEGAMKASLEAY